jgi:hypothetical protein
MAKPKKTVVQGRKDEKGLVKIQVFLVDDDGGRIAGNLTRSFKIGDAKVSDVATAIETTVVAKPDIYSLKNLG